MDRRQFLLTGACSLASAPLMTPVALADAPWDNRLVVIILRGAMDGLDVFRPVGDPDFAGLRPNLNDGQGIGLDDFWQMHPALRPLLPLWQKGELGVVPATSTPYRDKRSHFDGQDLLEAGGAALDGQINDGWLNRLVQTVPGASANTAFAIGREPMAILAGEAAVARWSPDARLSLTPAAEGLLERVFHDDPLFREASAQAIALASQMETMAEIAADTESRMQADPMMAQAGQGAHVALARFAATQLRGATRIASFSLTGWDTHRNQRGGISRALGQLSDTILTLRAGLGPEWDKTAVLCLTEFGRTVRENGNKGTDHGTGGAMIFAGGAMRGGQFAGEWPGLAEVDLYDRRDLMPLTDVRAHAGWVMRGLFGLDRGLVERTVFPGLDLGSDLGLLRS